MKIETIRAFAIAGGVFAAGAVVVPLAMRSSWVMDPLVEQVEQEGRQHAETFNTDRHRLASVLAEFTNDRPVRVVRLKNDGAIVANEGGAEMFAGVDGEAVQVDDLRWLTLGEEGIVVGSLAE